MTTMPPMPYSLFLRSALNSSEWVPGLHPAVATASAARTLEVA